MQQWLDSVISACYNTQLFTDGKKKRVFIILLVLEGVKKFWFPKEKTVRYFGLKFPKAVSESCNSFKIIRAWQHLKLRADVFCSYQNRGHCQVENSKFTSQARLSNVESFGSTVEKSEVGSLVRPLRDFRYKNSDLE